jgi:hypothetical protein
MTMTFSRTLAIVAAWALLAPLTNIQAQDIQLASHAELTGRSGACPANLWFGGVMRWKT